MKFRPLPGNMGMIYQPELPAGTCRKNPCPDCFACQWCSEDRCQSCRCCRRQPPCGGEEAPAADRPAGERRT